VKVKEKAKCARGRCSPPSYWEPFKNSCMLKTI
jgi:hypothetical protein